MLGNGRSEVLTGEGASFTRGARNSDNKHAKSNSWVFKSKKN